MEVIPPTLFIDVALLPRAKSSGCSSARPDQLEPGSVGKVCQGVPTNKWCACGNWTKLPPQLSQKTNLPVSSCLAALALAPTFGVEVGS